MPEIKIKTIINAKRLIVFDLSRSIDLHKISTEHTNETAIDGKTEGLIELGEFVTWRAKHFGIYQHLTSKITKYDRPNSFTDEMVKGAFKSFKHDHYFKEVNGRTEMIDLFTYESPLGILGNIADSLFLENYIKRLLIKRNDTIKLYAESGKWEELLTSTQK
ncbi:SRPBCC family protein [Aquimarina intermedia]|uniref:Ligand-binding SRPBCC domain-containing protein n=1 Tax=Aquimarina intermedia TaxID=350814 RepID=A0A5S5C884_9FLAO|nr:SRPBCC family protein [Aquimarina intermedia]TYP74203.1 hypothetical protein BD809_10418 [Aquimarina intermedia]